MVVWFTHFRNASFGTPQTEFVGVTDIFIIQLTRMEIGLFV